MYNAELTKSMLHGPIGFAASRWNNAKRATKKMKVVNGIENRRHNPLMGVFIDSPSPLNHAAQSE